MQLIFKLFGASLLFVCGALTGYKRGEQPVIRAQMLKDIIEILIAVKTNIQYKRDTTQQILCSAVCQCKTNKIKFVLPVVSTPDFPKALQNALKALKNETEGFVLEEEFSQFARVILQLGKGGAQEEIEKLSFTIATLTTALNDAQAEAKIQRKLYRSVGLSAGAAAALLFL